MGIPGTQKGTPMFNTDENPVDFRTWLGVMGTMLGAFMAVLDIQIAWLARVFSVRWYLMVNVALFLVFSCLCGIAGSLGEMIVFRACQGFTGGVMIPMALTVALSMLPKSKRSLGLALFGITATFGPPLARASADG